MAGSSRLFKTTLMGLGMLTLLLACAARPVSYTILERGSSGMRSDDLNFAVVTSNGEFKSLWARIHAFRSPMPPAPSVDFSKKIALYAGTGQKPTTGYGIEVSELTLHDGTIRVDLDFENPPAQSIQGQMLTNPFILLSVDRPESLQRIEFRDEKGRLLSLAEISR